MENPKNIPKGADYKIPENYFIDFQERLHVQIEFEEIVGTKKTTGFTVPKGYFANFPEKVLQQTAKPTKVVSLFKTKWIYAVASVAAILLFLFILEPFDTKYTFDAIENDTIAEYLETNTVLSAYDVGELLTDEELENISNTIQLEDTEVLDYLDTITDPYDLMIQ
ncbi:hypothetical protein ACFO3O_16990 [Dokdonia ponticola]|uniref:Uncharacterized protein n=1 Tax=Dokdonia ponticola TaxID=2041041 RepID=A0ABV9I0N6_9FLAO